MRRQVAITVRLSPPGHGVPILETGSSDSIIFNTCEANLVGARISDYDLNLHVCVANPNLPEIQDFETTPEIPIERARVKYPYLFTKNTNPILYWVFN